MEKDPSKKRGDALQIEGSPGSGGVSLTCTTVLEVFMGRYNIFHGHCPGPLGPFSEDAKSVKIKDKVTGNSGYAEVWNHQSYEEAEEKAWDRLQEHNEEDEEDEDD